MTDDPLVAGQQNQTQRVRVGMIGLACVFLLVMLATTFISLGSGGGGADANLATSAQANDSTPREPLAELGVAPGAPLETTPAIKPPHR